MCLWVNPTVLGILWRKNEFTFRESFCYVQFAFVWVPCGWHCQKWSSSENISRFRQYEGDFIHGTRFLFTILCLSLICDGIETDLHCLQSVILFFVFDVGFSLPHFCLCVLRNCSSLKKVYSVDKFLWKYFHTSFHMQRRIKHKPQQAKFFVKTYFPLSLCSLNLNNQIRQHTTYRMCVCSNKQCQMVESFALEFVGVFAFRFSRRISISKRIMVKH